MNSSGQITLSVRLNPKKNMTCRIIIQSVILLNKQIIVCFKELQENIRECKLSLCHNFPNIFYTVITQTASHCAITLLIVHHQALFRTSISIRRIVPKCKNNRSIDRPTDRMEQWPRKKNGETEECEVCNWRGIFSE